jgi:uncharacterized protein (UPF0332 family)
VTEVAWKLMGKAQRAIGAARRDLEASEPEFAAGHTYYAMFYTAEALLATRDLTFSSHGAVHGAIGKEFVKTGELDAKFHRWLLTAFRERQEATYDLDEPITAARVQEAIVRAEEFLAAAKGYLAAEE